jgi:hypothetical protein
MSPFGRRGPSYLPNRRGKTGICGVSTTRARLWDPLVCSNFVAFETSDRTTENRGVPGSGPGLAIARKAPWTLDLAVSGVSSAILKKGMKGDSRLKRW